MFRSKDTPRWDAAEIERRKAEIVERHGPWTAESIDLGHGIRTGGYEDLGIRGRLRAVTQSIADAFGVSTLRGLRILDLGCLEGLFAIELARHGAKVVAIDVRESNAAQRTR